MTDPIDVVEYRAPIVAPPRPVRRKRWPWIAAGCAVVLAAAGGLAFVLLPGKTITVHGTLTIADTSAVLNGGSGGESCDVVGAPAVSAGSPVTVTASNGDTLALGQLGTPTRTHDLLVDDCHWAFTIGGVPAGRGPYSIEIAHSGKVAFAQADAGSLELTLGS